ncbi:MAG TPA: protein kinase [Myxococcales bacterium]|jgi:serine/threonine-protein kinase
MRQSPLRVFRVQCEDEAQFLGQVAARIARKGLFLEAARPDPVGTPIRLRLELEPAGRVVLGEGLVVRHGFGSRSGEVVRLVRLDPAGLQFDLGDGFTGEPTTPPFSVQIAPAGPEWRRDPRKSQPPHVSAASLRLLGPEGWVGGLRPFDAVGPYQLLSRLGSGKRAEVYLARALAPREAGLLVALKMALPDFGPGSAYGDLFVDEARVAALLRHPNLVQVLDVGEAAGRLYLAAEYVQGWTVAQILEALRARARPPDAGFAMAVALEVCRALEHVHGRRSLDGQALGLVHREVRAGNVLVSGRGEVKLADFGLPSANPRRGSAAPSPEWDIHDLGALLAQMLTLQPEVVPPLAEPSTFNPECPPVLDALVRSCVLPPPGQRPPSASEVRERLEQIAACLPWTSPATLGADLLGERLECDRRDVAALQAEAARKRSGKKAPSREQFGVRARGVGLWAAAAGVLAGLVAAAAVVATHF